MESAYERQTLHAAIVYFASLGSYYLASRRWKCREKHPARQFSVKVGTVMEDSSIGLDKSLTAMWQIVNCKSGASSYEVHGASGSPRDQHVFWAIGFAARWVGE
jgi:hypothetical protein